MGVAFEEEIVLIILLSCNFLFIIFEGFGAEGLDPEFAFGGGFLQFPHAGRDCAVLEGRYQFCHLIKL